MSRVVQYTIKRIADTILAFAGLIIASPILLITAIFIKSGSPGSVFFIQERTGYQGRTFRIFKLRTMLNLWDEKGNLLPDEQRINPIGRFLRATSIDELPQLINILKGEMSFIGPRPLPVSYLEYYTPEQMRRHEVLPGMGSYADIVFNRTVPDWPQIFNCDVYYVDRWSLWWDMKLFVQIAVMVLTRRGTEQGSAGQMPAFTKYEKDTSVKG